MAGASARRTDVQSARRLPDSVHGFVVRLRHLLGNDCADLFEEGANDLRALGNPVRCDRALHGLWTIHRRRDGRARTIYAVTDRGAVIVSGITGRDIKSLFLAGLNEIDVQERSSGRGTIVLGPSAGYANPWGRSWPGTKRATPLMFEGIENPRGVYDIIRRAQQALTSPHQK